MTTELSEADKAICRGAAQHIAEKGWHQGGYFADGDGASWERPACMLGAIAVVDDVVWGFGRWQNILRPHLPDGFTQAHEWNDHPSTTAEDVILFLKELGS
ncbi:DUF6197 family protein [Streptomyces sp. NPDC055085]